ncbi:MAG: malto-oligosyltrehalose trehalohydrolase [Desulfurivibrio sp.]|nr:malto-oligosyltrehalose trehalohydrolase [Desulfurivibrio sp.]
MRVSGEEKHDLPGDNPLWLWAPAAQRVELQLAGQRQAMRAATAGWWQAPRPPAHGEDYTFFLDDAGPFPDPRSPWQPAGVDAPSRHLDHRRFAWHDQGWQAPPLAAAVIYELHIGTFTPEGTFLAVIDKLDHLLELGVTHIELLPVATFAGPRGWGYDGVDLYAPHPAYGPPEDLKKLVDACHRRGLAVLLDVVYNHLGPAGNYLNRFGPYFTDHYRTPWGEAVNFDGADSEPVRRFFIDNALMWLRDYHFDGLRLDAVHAIFDRSALHFLEQLAAEVQTLEAECRRHLVVIAESDLNDPRLVRPPEVGGYGLDAMWNEDFHHALHAALTGETQGYYADFGGLAPLAKVLQRGQAYEGDYSPYRRRPHGRPATDLAGRQQVAFLQNHDQVGNRARGERLSQLLKPGQLKLAAALLLTAPFVPLLFQGEEWGATNPFLYFTAHPDPELAAAVSRGRQQEFAAFGWSPAEIPDPQAPATFTASQLDWHALQNAPHAELLAWYRQLIQLRRHTPALNDDRPGQVEVIFDEQRQWLRLKRGSLLVAANFAAQARRLPLPPATSRQTLLSSPVAPDYDGDNVLLAGHGVAILQIHNQPTG